MTDEPVRPPDDADRVRACPECGEVVPFAERTCPSCGHHDPLGPPPEETGPCPHCGEPMAVRGLFCGHCGREREPAPLPPPVAGPVEDASSGREDVVVLVLDLLGPLVLLGAVLLAWLQPA